MIITTQRGIQSDISKQLFEALAKIEKLEKAYDFIDELKKDFSKKEKAYHKEISELKSENKSLKNIIETQNNEIKNLKGEILGLHTKNKKDSSNSSKPSSTNGYKKVITNRRKKSKHGSDKPQGIASTNLSNKK